MQDSAAVFEKILPKSQQSWLVTGVAGFIGSNILEVLLRGGQKVTGLDDFSTGSKENLALVREAVGEIRWKNFVFIEGDIRELALCRRACTGADYLLHQAALGSVPRSIADPLTSNSVNIDGTLNIFVAARDAGIKWVVYASSSSVYGDSEVLPKVEEQIGKPLSPYATTKLVNEFYASVFARCYGQQFIGLRYFNVFGPRQSPEGPYAAVIPRWIDALNRGEQCTIYGDGETSRDFCHVDNAVQANLRAALVDNSAAVNQLYNVAVGEQTTLKELHHLIVEAMGLTGREPRFADFRAGDIRHSKANIGKAEMLLQYQPTVRIGSGIGDTVRWFLSQLKKASVS